ncbi:clavesin-2-like [Musca vetustissima]|uniref:clavesin-2-like n=1 Tax=Musca vetustissima TaxID=27455 RepID=UPI002AB7ECDA|nr:clavesin-2-like [Musca vetustissima]
MSQEKTLPSTLQSVAIEELFEIPSRIPDDLQALKLWIEQQPHLTARTDDQFLLQFLRGCKYSMERAKEKIERFYTMKTKFPETLGIYDLDNERFRQVARLGCVAPLPIPLNGDGCRLVMGHFNYNPQEYRVEEIYHVGSAMYEIFLIDDPYACICGIINIVDMSQVTMAHLLHENANFLKTGIEFIESAMPLRNKAVYFVNVSPAAAQFFNFFIPLFSEKLRKRIFICSTLEDLKQHIPLKYLPEYYGGENGSMEHHIKALKAKFDEYREYFQDNVNYGVNESLRQEESSDVDKLFGLGGSFRKLEVD